MPPPTASPLLETKLYPGVGARQSLARPRLELPAAAANGTSTVVSVVAPAGYGKSTLMAHWYANWPHPRRAWLSLDEQDNAPRRILRYLVGALKTAMPERSNDFTFVNDGRDKWGLGFLITSAHVSGKRSEGSLSWGGINNTYFWLDPSRGVAGVIMMQFLPFADAKALGVYDAFERGVYRTADASP